MKYNLLIRIANEYIPQSSDEYSNGERYYPTEQDILDMNQKPFEKIIRPLENQIKQFLFKEIKHLMTAQVRHYIHKHKDDSIEKIYNFVLSKINFNLIFDNLLWSSFETLELIDDNTISEKQLKYDFINYIKKYFSLYIHLLIDKYKNEIILNYNQQSQDKNYNSDPYIRTPEQLDLLIDDVGDDIQLDQSFNINYKCRDSAFIFVKNTAFTGNSHINLMNKYIEQNNINDPYYFNIENIDKIQLPYAYGHIYRGRALINWHKYCTVEEVKDALLKKGKYKIYDYNTNAQTLHRLAQKII